MTMKTAPSARRCAAQGQPLLWILGPCVIESHDMTLRIADKLKELADWLHLAAHVQGVVRTRRTVSSASRFAGPLAGRAAHLDAVKQRTGLPVTTGRSRAGLKREAVAEVCDLLQVPAFFGPATDLLFAVGATGRGRQRADGAVNWPPVLAR